MEDGGRERQTNHSSLPQSFIEENDGRENGFVFLELSLLGGTIELFCCLWFGSLGKEMGYSYRPQTAKDNPLLHELIKRIRD